MSIIEQLQHETEKTFMIYDVKLKTKTSIKANYVQTCCVMLDIYVN